MTDLDAARLTMGLSLGFHIILASIGMAMPFLLALAHRNWLKTGDEAAYRLTRMWARGVAIFFATGAVSGTALSFELGVLWPGFMEHAGPIIGIPFSLEGVAFFIEAIALGLYLYGWRRMSPRVHWWMAIGVGVSGVASGALVIAANGWMNSPTGFRWVDGQAVDIDPIAAMLNPAWGPQALHMVIASFAAVGFAVAGVHALLWLRGRRSEVNALALRLSLGMGAIAALIQPLQGHAIAQSVAERQPIKLAAMEALFETQTGAPLLIGGLPDVEARTVSYAIEIPGALSFMAYNDFDAEVMGLDQVPRDEWPPVTPIHFAFQIMVAIGGALAALSLLALFAIVRRRHWLEARWMLKLLVLAAPLGFVAIEAGWCVTELGRQPWIIYQIMRTKDALTPVPGQVYHLVAFMSLYALIGLSTIWMWSRLVRHGSRDDAPSAEITAWARGKRP